MLATGTYVGDGTDGRVISTGLTGTIRSVELMIRDQSPAYVGNALMEKTDTMPGDSYVQAVVSPLFIGLPGAFGIALGPAADFTVNASSVSSQSNLFGIVYHWVAFSTNP